MRGVWGVVGGLLLGGCVQSGQSAYLRWKEGPPSGRLDGKVALKLVPNLRPPEKGDRDLADIGRERAQTGKLVDIKLAGDQNPRLDYTVVKMTMAALRTAGLGITQPEDPSATAHLTVEIHDFWCEGAVAARASVGLELVLIDPLTGGERLRVPVSGAATASECKEAFRLALGEVFHGLANAFAEPEVHGAALGNGGPTPDENPAPGGPPVATPNGS